MFKDYYSKLAKLKFKQLHPHLVTAQIINLEESQNVLDTATPYPIVLNKISLSLEMGTTTIFDKFLLLLENHDDILSKDLAEQIKRDLLKPITGILAM